MDTLLKLLIFFVIGSGVKYIDAAYDDHVFPTSHTVILSIALGFLTGGCMIWDHTLLLISLSILVGVFVTGKLDILPFRLLAGIAVSMTAIFFKSWWPLHASDWRILAFMASAAAIDEIGNDLADSGVLRGRVAFFFLNRGYLKVLAAIFVAARYLSLFFLFSCLAFDVGYFTFTSIANRRSRSRHQLLIVSRDDD